MISADVGMRAASVNCWAAATVVWLCAAIAIAVFAAMIYSVIAFHRSAGHGVGKGVSGKSAQIVWSLIPIGIFLGTAVPAVTKLLFTNDHCGM